MVSGALLVSLLAYLVGSIPIGYLVAKYFLKTDIQSIGSGNIGATNIFRLAGWRYALPVFIVDILKGAIPVAITQLLSPDFVSFAVFFVVLGNIFSVFLSFSGGKGMATATGALVVVLPLHVITGLVLFAVIAKSTRLISLSSLITGAIVIIGILVSHAHSVPIKIASLFVFCMILYGHRANIIRLIKNEEQPIKRMTKKEKTKKRKSKKHENN